MLSVKKSYWNGQSYLKDFFGFIGFSHLGVFPAKWKQKPAYNLVLVYKEIAKAQQEFDSSLKKCYWNY